MILSCNDICKAFGTDEILKHVSFHIEDREKAAIVGINGAGKSTLMKIIAGDSTPDTGQVILAHGATMGYLAQHQNLDTDNTIFDELLSIKADILNMESTMRRLEADMKNVEGAELEDMLERYSRLTHSFEQMNGYAYKSEITGVLKGLGFTEEDFTKKVNTLSGGQKTRVALACCLQSLTLSCLMSLPTILTLNPSSGLRLFFSIIREACSSLRMTDIFLTVSLLRLLNSITVYVPCIRAITHSIPRSVQSCAI